MLKANGRSPDVGKTMIASVALASVFGIWVVKVVKVVKIWAVKIWGWGWGFGL